MGIVNKEEVLYMATQVDITGLKEGKKEALGILQSLVQESSSMDAFSGISMAAAVAFSQAAGDVYAFSQDFDRAMDEVAGRVPEVAARMEDYRTQVLALTMELPVMASDCARALGMIVQTGRQGTEAMDLLREAAFRAVAATASVTDVFEHMDAGEGCDTSRLSTDVQAVVANTEAQVQLLQNRMVVLLRPLGNDLLQQVAEAATRLGQALSAGEAGNGLKELDALVTVAAAALRDYKIALDEGTEAVTTESVALDVAKAVREAYRQVMDEERGVREEVLAQQADYRNSLAETMMLEEEINGRKLNFAQQSIELGGQLSGIVAAEITRVRQKKEVYTEELGVKQALLQAAEGELVQAGVVREVRQKEVDTLKWGNDQARITLANTRLQQAVEQEAAVTVGVDNARREVRNAQLRLEAVNRQSVTAAVVANTVATGNSVVADGTAATSTTLLARAKQAATVATRSLTAALAANPLGMVLSVVSLAITAFAAFGKESAKVAGEQERLNEALRKQKEDMGTLAATLFDGNREETARADALLKLRKLMPEVWEKVNLANLAEQDRNALLKTGNEELNLRNKRELEAARATSQRRIEELKALKQPSMATVGGTSAGAMAAGDLVADGAVRGKLEKEQKNLREIEEQLRTIAQIDALKGGLGLSADERMKNYKIKLGELQGQLELVNAQLQLKLGDRVFQESFDPAQFPEAAGLLERLHQIQQQTADTEGYISRLKNNNKPDREGMNRRQQLEQQLTEMMARMYRQREKMKLDLESEGLEKELKRIGMDYEERAGKIREKEAELQALYGKAGIPPQEQQMIQELKSGNDSVKKEEERQAEEKYNAEIKQHIEEQKVLFLSTEEQKLKAIEERYNKERAWAESHKGQFKEGEYDAYTEKLATGKNTDKRAVLLGNLRDIDRELSKVKDQWEVKIRLAGDDAGLKDLFEKAQAKEESRLNMDKLVNTDEWVRLFSELDELTISEIDGLIGTIETQLAGTELNPVDSKALRKNLNEAKQQVIALNPFHALGTSLQAVFTKGDKASKQSAGEIQDNWKNLGKSTEGCFNFINDAVSGCEVLSDLIGQSGRESMQMVQGIATAGIAMGAAIQKAETSSIILTAISAALQVVNALVSVFNKDKKKEKHIQSLQAEIEGLERSYDKLGDAIDRTYSDKSFDMMDQQEENLRQQQELIRQQIAAEQSKKKTDKGKVQEWQNQLEDIDAQIAENQRKRIEMLAGTDVKSAIDEFADALVEAYARGEDGATALGETTKKVMANAVKEALKRKFLGEQIEAAVNYLGGAMDNGVLSNTEKSTFKDMVAKAGERFSAALATYDDLFGGETGTATGVSGQLQEAMTEGTANQLVGLWNMTANDIRSMRNLTAEQLNQCVLMNLNVGEVLRQQYFIEMNTRQTAGNTALTVEELKGGFNRLDNRLRTIDENTKGYVGRGK